MTVQLTTALRINGAVQNAGTQVSLTEAEEADLVHRRVATWVSADPSVQGQEIILSATDANGGRAADALQRALDVASAIGGRVRVLPGLYTLSKVVYYDSATVLHCDPGAVFRGAAGNDKPLLVSRAYLRMTQAPNTVTITWTSGMTFTVNWTNHGLDVGNAVWINGATLEAQFKGVFLVESVTNANAFVLRAYRIPTAGPTGTIQAVRATENVQIRGGVWDFNYDGSFPVSELDRHAFMHFGVSNVWEYDTIINNTPKFTRYWSAHLNCGFQNIGSQRTESDMVKLYGPGFGFRGHGMWGECGDDAVSIQTREPPVFANYQPYWGDVINCVVRDIHCTAATSLAVFYTRRIADGIIDDCWYESVKGRAPNGVRIYNASDMVPETLEYSARRIGARGIRSDCTFVVKADAFLGQSVEIVDPDASISATTVGDQILTASTFYARTFKIVNPIAASDSYGSSGGYYVGMAGGADMLIIEAGHGKTSGGGLPRLLDLKAASTVRHAYVQSANTDADTLIENNATNTPTITLHASRVGGAACISVRASCNVNLTGGNDFTNASNGVIRFNATATVNLRTDGTNRLRAGSWVLAPAGTPTLNVYGWDIAIDPIAAPGIATTQGQFCWSTQAGAEGGPSVRGPSAWYALAAGASGVNGAIT